VRFAGFRGIIHYGLHEDKLLANFPDATRLPPGDLSLPFQMFPSFFVMLYPPEAI
jgi:hypothetical protein